MKKIKIGYLHIYAKSFSYISGVTRYGKKLAEAGKIHFEDQVSIQNYDLMISGEINQDLQAISKAVNFLNKCHVIQMQFCRHLWGDGVSQRLYIKSLLGSIKKPIIVTIHDIYEYCYPSGNIFSLFFRENHEKRRQAKFKSFAIRSTLRKISEYLYDRKTIEYILSNATQVLTCNHEEKRRIAHLKKSDKIKVIPHFIEPFKHEFDLETAKEKLGINHNKKVVTLQGFIHPAKGHQIAVEALSELPEDIQLIFAGTVPEGSQDFLAKIMTIAEKKGVKDRLLVTGYLSDQEMALYLAATDLAICPFVQLSASGSLSTWLAAERPILASDLPQIREYNQLCNVISTFFPYTSSELSAKIQNCLARENKHMEAVVLKKTLGLDASFERHLELYKLVVKEES